jgi:Exodeoxyribonuclease V, gamma subunit
VGLFQADSTLESRDVLVMWADVVEEFAPLISATFGMHDGEPAAHHPRHRLRVRLADRSLRQTNPLLSAIAALLKNGRHAGNGKRAENRPGEPNSKGAPSASPTTAPTSAPITRCRRCAAALSSVIRRPVFTKLRNGRAKPGSSMPDPGR